LLAAPQARIETHGSMAMKWVWVMLLAGLSGCGGVPRGLQPVQNFDLRRFEGHWYEIARLDHRYERGLTRVSIDYRALPDDRVEIDSRGYDTIRREWRSQNGIARFQGSRNEASLEVSFLDAFHSGYNVLYIDPGYRYALVAGSNRHYFWLLSRTPQLDSSVIESLLARARVWGFDTAALHYIRQVGEV
jgi:apolipoprotein D and lipocalin family protein